MPKIYVGTRRKSSETPDLQSVTITLPKPTLIGLANNGVESGRGSGNVSGYLECAAEITLGLFTDPTVAYEYLTRLVRVDTNREYAFVALADHLEIVANMLRDTKAG